MYANHVTGTFGQMTVELHITSKEFMVLPDPARQAIGDRGKLVAGSLGGPSCVYHLRHADALHIEELIDEAS